MGRSWALVGILILSCTLSVTPPAEAVSLTYVMMLDEARRLGHNEVGRRLSRLFAGTSPALTKSAAPGPASGADHGFSNESRVRWASESCEPVRRGERP